MGFSDNLLYPTLHSHLQYFCVLFLCHVTAGVNVGFDYLNMFFGTLDDDDAYTYTPVFLLTLL